MFVSLQIIVRNSESKTRSEVAAAEEKPWRQKGTGHARQGSTRAPQWTGGGVVFAPTPRDYEIKMNKKERRLALKSALTSRVQENKLIVLDDLKLDEVKTKAMQAVLTTKCFQSNGGWLTMIRT